MPGAHPLSYADYLETEAASDWRHDFIGADLRPRATSTIEHGALSASFAGLLGAALGGKRCRMFGGDVRVRVAATNTCFYPDASVVCMKLETAPDDANAVANPVVLVEVLSPSSEAYDRGTKAAHYRQLSSLAEYVLVHEAERLVEVQRRNERGIWELHFFGPGENIELASLGVSVSVDAVYANPLPA